MIGKIIVALALLVVAGTLAMGFVSMWIGGEFDRKWANRLMRYRVVAQFVAILIIMAVLYFGSQH